MINTTTNASVTLSYKPGAVNAQILVDFTTQTVRSNGISIPYTGIMPIGFIRLPERCANLAFGGTYRNRLFMAGSTSLYSLYVNTQGAAGG